MQRRRQLPARMISLLLALTCALPVALDALCASPSAPPASVTPSAWQLLIQSPVMLAIAILLILAGLTGTIVVLRLMPKRRD